MTLRADGSSTSLWPAGCVVYAGVVLIANYQLLLAFNSYYWFGVLLIVLSVVLYFVFLLIEALPAIGVDYILGIFSHVMDNPLTYFAFIFLIGFVYGFEKLTSYIGESIEKK